MSILALLIYGQCFGLEISVSNSVVLLSGTIVPGDAERLIGTLIANPVSTTIRINSPGGDVAEAIRLASIVTGSRLRLVVEGNGGFCASACFFLFLAADERVALGGYPNGTIPPALRARKIGFVGIHRTSITFAGADTNSSIEKQDIVVRDTETYLKAHRVPQNLIDEMLSRPSNDIYWISDKDLDTIGMYSPGYEEALVKKCGYIRFSRMVQENWSTSRINEHLKDFDNCAGSFWENERFPLSLEFYIKLKEGWRPWIKSTTTEKKHKAS
jgi:hypothetical protein